MQAHRGSYLLEVLISLMILSISLLGLDCMQIISFQETNHAFYTSVALQQLQTLAEILSIKNVNVAQQIADWQTNSTMQLPNGKSNVNANFPHFSARITWGNVTQDQCQEESKGLSGCLTLKI